MITVIPAFVLALLGQPNPALVQTDIRASENVVCWSSPARAVCFQYRDEGTHLAIVLNNGEV